MLRAFMRSKVHRATVTDSNLNYVGSITMPPELLRRADIGLGEVVQVLDIDNGHRFETYTIPGAPGSDDICINGAAARLVQPGDKVIVITYAYLTPDEIADHDMTVVHVDEHNVVVDDVVVGVPPH